MARYFKIKTLMDEIRANGIAQTGSTLIQRDSQGKVISACAIGMGAVNLGLDENELNNLLDDIKIKDDRFGESNLASLIIELNDGQGFTFAQIADYVEENYPELMHKRVSVSEKTFNI